MHALADAEQLLNRSGATGGEAGGRQPEQVVDETPGSLAATLTRWAFA